MNRKREDIRTALDTTLSGVSNDPELFIRSKKDMPPAKQKMISSLVLAMVLLMVICTVAIVIVLQGG